jgi:hypothetical protein
MNHLAVYALYPNVVQVDDTAGVFDAQGNKVEIDMALVNAWVDPNAYMYKRAKEYPPLTELADAMYWSSQGDNTKLEAYYAACEAVKLKYPKVINE